ncbi:MAG: cytochrome oxidase subunit III [Sphingomonadales bacterium]|nr:cytochrome oxidase subunit III [Sphingomonadales bacterium]MBM3923773.1 cytochrome oxidase subunit III [Sphingomonadales bacterium]
MKNLSPSTPSGSSPRSAVHPREFLMWGFLVSVFMLFAGLTSAFIVRRADGNWLQFELPKAFAISTLLVVISTVTLELARRATRRNEFGSLRIWLWATAVLGLAFLASQFYAYLQLTEQGIFLVGNPSGSFLYVISGMHALHIVAAVLAVLVTLYKAYRLEVHSKNLLGMRILAIFWHFLTILWLYLYTFLWWMH